MTSRRILSIDPSERAKALRLAALNSYDILDTPREEAFDDIVRIASVACGTPVALVSFLDDERQWFKAKIGVQVCETPVEQSLCVNAIRRPGLFIVEDLETDPRFARNPDVAWLSPLRFYAGAPIITPDGFILGTVCVLDRTPRQLTQDQQDVLLALARQAARQLEMRKAIALSTKANQYRSRLMAVAGHDLKQPLQVISMILVAHQIKSDEATKIRLQMALDAVKKLSIDLDRLALASKTGDEMNAPKAMEFPLSFLMDSLESTWREHATQRNVSFRVRRCSLHVWSDPIMLTTILGNLVGNAIKYTPAQGRIVVGCRRRGYGARISVIDTGPGISPARQEAVFAAFHQENPASEGLGLGLSIVARTAEALGLRVSVRSTVGRGSAFSIDIPSAETAAGAAFP